MWRSHMGCHVECIDGDPLAGSPFLHFKFNVEFPIACASSWPFCIGIGNNNTFFKKIHRNRLTGFFPVHFPGSRFWTLPIVWAILLHYLGTFWYLSWYLILQNIYLLDLVYLWKYGGTIEQRKNSVGFFFFFFLPQRQRSQNGNPLCSGIYDTPDGDMEDCTKIIRINLTSPFK